MKSNRLVLMVTAPEARRLRSRLIAQMGGEKAVEVYSEIVEKLAHDLSKGDWTFSLAVWPERVRHIKLYDDYLSFTPKGADRGRRLADTFLEMPPGPVLVVDSYCPYVTTDDVKAAFEALRTNDIVFGPTTQGGFWGVGQKREPVPLDPFRNIDYKEEKILQPVLKNLRADRKVAMVRELTDIWTTRDWDAYKNGVTA